MAAMKHDKKNEKGKQDQENTQSSASSSGQSQSKRRWGVVLWAVVLIGVLLVALAFYLRERNSGPTGSSNTPSQQESSSTTSSDTSPTPSPAAGEIGSSAIVSSPAGVSLSVTSSPVVSGSPSSSNAGASLPSVNSGVTNQGSSNSPNSSQNVPGSSTTGVNTNSGSDSGVSGSYTYTAKRGDTLHWLVRRSLVDYLRSSSINIDNNQRIFVETNVAMAMGYRRLKIGERVVVSRQDLEMWVERSKNLTSAQKRAWSRYAARVNYNI